MFDSHLCEAEHEDKRLVVRRNDSVRIRETRRREDKLTQLAEKLATHNTYVAQAKRADAQNGLVALSNWVKRHKLGSFVTLGLDERKIVMTLDEAAKLDDALLEGCCILETNVAAGAMSAETVDERYRDLQKVERDFRTIKTSFLEIRPIFLRRADRTRTHVFVAMLALKIVRRLESLLRKTFGTTDDHRSALTAEDALVALGRLTYLYHQDGNGQRQTILPRPDEMQAIILDALGLSFPRKTMRAEM